MFQLVHYLVFRSLRHHGYVLVKLGSKEETLLGNGGLCVLQATHLAAYCQKDARLGGATGL